MSEGPPKRSRLRRAVYEWSTIAFGFLSVACLVFWVVSVNSSIADLVPLEPRNGLVLSISGGSFCGRSRADETIAELGAWATSKRLDPPLVGDRELTVPGFRYRALRLADEQTRWAFEMSMLFPFVVSAILAAACFYRHRVSCRKPVSQNPISD